MRPRRRRRTWAGCPAGGVDTPARTSRVRCIRRPCPTPSGSTTHHRQWTPQSWRLIVVDAAGSRPFTLADLAPAPLTRRVTLDCTSGWYAHQDWTGTPVRTLIRDVGDARSLHVRSVTGYWVRLPVTDLDDLLLATAVGGAPLSRGHGFPLRLVAPGRRGFWWVKWVDRIELQTTPWWWQPPFPVT